MESYYEQFFVQGEVIVQRPNPFPPFLPPFFNDVSFGDKDEIQGVYVLDTTTEGALSETNLGRFACSPNIPLSKMDVIRRVSDNTLYRINGAAKISPSKARVQVAMYDARLIDRGEA